MNPICNKCNVEMRCLENGVTVAHVNSPKWIRKGDRYTCPKCGTKIITSMGEPSHEEVMKAIVMVEDCLRSDAKVKVLDQEVDFMAMLEELEANGK